MQIWTNQVSVPHFPESDFILSTLVQIKQEPLKLRLSQGLTSVRQNWATWEAIIDEDSSLDDGHGMDSIWIKYYFEGGVSVLG